MLKRAISADSHITEPPNIYTDYVDPAFRSRAPRLVTGGPTGDFYVIDGMPHRIPMGLIAAAGKNAIQLSVEGRWERDEYRGGWDPEARMADQDRDGIAAEVIYPSVGMLLCNHPDPDYKKSCFDAYNRWLAEILRGASRPLARPRANGDAFGRRRNRGPAEDQGIWISRRHAAGLSGRQRLRPCGVRPVL